MSSTNVRSESKTPGESNGRVGGNQPRELRRVLMITPHFPPDTGAATHRVRLLAPHLREFGWEPTVLTVERSANEGRLDPDLEAMVPTDLRVLRASAWRVSWTRKLGVGDLGLRAFTGLYKKASQLLKSEKYDALFITIFPSYPALLGALLKSRLGIPFVLDYMDPWVSAWGKEVGGGKKGAVDLKSRLTRLAALRLEPVAVRAADAITAVSAGTYEMIQQRIPEARRIPCVAIPLGGEAADFAYLRKSARRNSWFDKKDGNFHICYVGTLLPLGFDTLRAVFSAVALLRESAPAIYNRMRFHFFGTSNQTAGEHEPRVTPVAREMGISEIVSERPLRLDYLDALKVQVDSSAILLMGSSERHYTASKLYPALLAGRPLLGVYHSESSVAAIMQQVTAPPAAHIVTYHDSDPVQNHAGAIAAAFQALVEHPMHQTIAWRSAELDKFSARSLASQLADVFDQIASKSLSGDPRWG